MIAVGPRPVQVAASELPLTILYDPDMKVARLWQACDEFTGELIHGLYLLAPDGRMLWRDIGELPFEHLDWLLAETARLLRLVRAG